MAHTIHKEEWSEAEELHWRCFYWRYLVNRWLVPGPSVLRHREPNGSSGRVGPSTRTLHENGWFHEPESTCEQ
ncbi:MAG TPA: hypothetical protein VLK65_28440 [Vicinamibacteria bacterium]|nr:hypothetical protein [Vicinamibacteria bacterium]